MVVHRLHTCIHHKCVSSMHAYAAFSSVACSKRSDSGERCEVKKAMKSRGELGREVRFPLSPLPLPRFYFFALLFTSHRSPLSERLEQAISSVASLRFSHRGERDTRVSGDEAQWTTGRRKSRAPYRPFQLERRLDRRQHTYVFVTCHVFKVEFTVQSKQLPGSFFFTTSSTM